MFFLQTLKKRCVSVQCEMFIYVKCLCCDVKHPIETETNFRYETVMLQFKDHMKKKKVTTALFPHHLLKQQRRVSCN